MRTRLAGMTQKVRMACITKSIEEGDEAIVAVLGEIHAFEGMAHHYDDVFRLTSRS